jgi:hypothetical protein
VREWLRALMGLGTAGRDVRPALPSRAQVAAVGVVTILGAAGCFVGLLAGPDDEWAKVLYVYGLALAPLVAILLWCVLRIRRSVVSSILTAAREFEEKIQNLLGDAPAEEYPARSRQAVELLSYLRGLSWALREQDAPREADAVAEAARDLATLVHPTFVIRP